MAAGSRTALAAASSVANPVPPRAIMSVHISAAPSFLAWRITVTMESLGSSAVTGGAYSGPHAASSTLSQGPCATPHFTVACGFAQTVSCLAGGFGSEPLVIVAWDMYSRSVPQCASGVRIFCTSTLSSSSGSGR